MINLISKYKVILIIILLISVNFLYIFCEKTFTKEAKGNEIIWDDAAATAIATSAIGVTAVPTASLNIPVYICGAVVKPGVYYVNSDIILDKAIQSAGGLTEEADPNSLNLARKVQSNEKIYIPKLGEKIDKPVNSYENSKEEANVADTFRVNINTSNETTLKTLPGIGETKAKAIVAYRENHGAFKRTEEIKNVSGIGDATYEKLKERITIE